WQQPVNDFSIAERRLEKTVTAIMSMLLAVVAIVGLGFGVRELLPAIERGAIIVTLLSRSWPMTAWWIGFLAAEFLLFRHLHRRTISTILTINDEPAPAQFDWQTAEKT